MRKGQVIGSRRGRDDNIICESGAARAVGSHRAAERAERRQIVSKGGEASSTDVHVKTATRIRMPQVEADLKSSDPEIVESYGPDILLGGTKISKSSVGLRAVEGVMRYVRLSGDHIRTCAFCKGNRSIGGAGPFYRGDRVPWGTAVDLIERSVVVRRCAVEETALRIDVAPVDQSGGIDRRTVHRVEAATLDNKGRSAIPRPRHDEEKKRKKDYACPHKNQKRMPTLLFVSLA